MELWSFSRHRSTGRACWSCRLTCTAETPPKRCEVGTQAMVQQHRSSCQYELWNRGFTLSVLTVPATATAVPWETGLFSVPGYSSEGMLCKSCQHVRKHSKPAWPPGFWTSDKCNVLHVSYTTRLYLKQQNLSSSSKCFKRFLKIKTLREGTLSDDIAESTIKTDVTNDKVKQMWQISIEGHKETWLNLYDWNNWEICF